MMMDLNAVTIFVKVAEAGGFVAAARTSGVPKSTIARRISELEQTLGVRLLQRTTRKSELTAAGRSFYQRCRRIVDDLDDAMMSVSAHQREPRGKLRVSTSVLLGEAFLGNWTVDYMQQHPHIEVDMFLTSRKVDLLADGFDLTIRVGHLESSSHIVRRLAPTPHYLCASPAYLKQHGTPTAVEELSRHRAILYSPERERRPWELENQAGEQVAIAVSSRLIVNSYPVAREACCAGFGLTELPALVACDALRSGRLVRLLPEWSNRKRWLHALFPSRQQLSASVRTYLDFMVSRLSPPPWA